MRIWVSRLHFGTFFHPHTDGRSEQAILRLEDMLKACVLDFGGSWDTCLPFVEFSYNNNNNNYHNNIYIPPLELFYGRNCWILIC